MKLYHQDPFPYRDQFHQQVGGAFTRISRNISIEMDLFHISLLRAGFKLAAPHVKRALKDIARDLSGQVIKK
jgi:hypothetical protein